MALGDDFELSLGAAPTNWGRRRLRRFYQQIARHERIARVYVGEVSCTKRRVLSADFFEEMCGLLTDGGVEVVLATPPIITSRLEFDELASLAEIAPALEANNPGTVALWRERFSEKTLVLGPYLDVYNEVAARFWRDAGASRVVAPIDIELETLSRMVEVFPRATEVVALGRPALAFSWRCYAARAFGKLGRECAFECYRTREIRLETLEGERLLAANGKAVYADRVYAPLRSFAGLRTSGVTTLRIEPAAPDETAALAMIDDCVALLSGAEPALGRDDYDMEYMAALDKRERHAVEVLQQ